MKINKKLLIILGIIFAITLRLIFFQIEGPDYCNFLSNWWQNINENGQILTLKHQIGDYTPPYNFILVLGTYLTNNSLIYIKVVSCIFDFLLALFSCLLMKSFLKKDYYKYFLLILFIPGVILNSAVLGQCDAIYTAFLIMFTYFICTDKKELGLIAYGIALSFKLQTIFIAPIFLYLLLTKKIKFYHLAWCILGFLIFNIPSLLLGRNLLGTFFAYLIQTVEYPSIVQSCPNIYSMLFLNYIEVPSFIKTILVFITLIITVFLVWPYKNEKTFSNKLFLKKIMLLSLLVPYLLPQMQDRYFYMANIFIVLFVCISNISTKQKFSIIIISCICYFLSVFSVNFIDNFIISQYILISFFASWLNYYIVLSMLSLKNEKLNIE